MSFLSILSFIGYLLIAFLCLTVMVVIHELGHFIAARRLGFTVKEFAVGMGPKLLSKKTKSGMVISFRLIPIGGFCAFEGDEEDEKITSKDEERAKKKAWKKKIGGWQSNKSQWSSADDGFEGIDGTQSNGGIEDNSGQVNKNQSILQASDEASKATVNESVSSSKTTISESSEANQNDSTVSDTASAEDGTSNASTKKPRSGAFYDQKPWKRLIVLFGGVFANFISAIILLALFFTFSGMIQPEIAPMDGVFHHVNSDLPENQRVMAGDVVIRVEGRRLNILEPWDFQRHLVDAGYDEALNLTVLRNVDGTQERVELQLRRMPLLDEDGNYLRDTQGRELRYVRNVPNTERYQKQGSYALDEDGNRILDLRFGFNLGLTRQRFGFFESSVRAFNFSFFAAGRILSSLGSLFTPTGRAAMGDTVGGPVTMLTTMTDGFAAAGGFAEGLTLAIWIVCLLSVNLAIFNILPLPALDGSRMIFTIIEWIRGKPIKRSVESMIHFVGIVLLFGMMILFDIMHFAS